MRRRGLSLTELMAVAAILAVLVSSSAVLYYEKYGGNILARESEDLTLWFYSVISRANNEGVIFKLYTAQRENGEYELRAVYAGESYSSAENIYTSSSANIRNEGGSSIMTYDGMWQTLSPALTLSIRSKEVNGGKLFLTISVYGLVTVKEKL